MSWSGWSPYAPGGLYQQWQAYRQEERLRYRMEMMGIDNYRQEMQDTEVDEEPKRKRKRKAKK